MAIDPLNTYVNSGGNAGGGTDSVDNTTITDLNDKHMPASCRSTFGGS
jgi:hypothetical protein